MNAIQFSTEEMALYAKFKAKQQEEEQFAKEMRDVWKRVKAKFTAEFAKFDWSEHFDGIRYDGSAMHFETARPEARKVQDSIGQLVRATLKCVGTRSISDEDEAKVEAITDHIIKFLLSFRE